MQIDVLLRNFVSDRGAGQPLVLAHGFGCDQGMWRFLSPALEKQCRVIQFDYVGCGRSDWSAYNPSRYADLAGYAQDVVEIVDRLDLHQAVFIGHSVSSMIGLLAARQRPERIGKLVMVAPSPCYLNDPPYTGGFDRADLEELLLMMERNAGWAHQLAGLVMANPERPELSEELETSFCSMDPAMALEFAAVTFFSDLRPELSGPAPECLILQSAEDALAPRSVGEFLHQQLAGSTLEVLASSGHCPHLSHPGLVLEAIQRYLHLA